MSEDNESTLNKFLLPEKEVSLKVVFDNLRNYVIVGAFVGMARWFEQGRATAPPGIFTGPPRSGWMIYAWLCIIVALALFALNAGQSYRIAVRSWKHLFKDVESRAAAGRPLPWYLNSLAFVLAAIATVLVLCMGFLLLSLAIYIAWYAATGAGR